MKVAVIGADGQLGRDVVAAFVEAGSPVTELTHADIEISSWESVRGALERLQPDLVVNTAAFHHVDKCESDPAKAFAVNGIGARNLAQTTASLEAILAHISTDYVFDGNKGSPYSERDCAIPLNVYGNTKLSGESFVQTLNPRHFVLRVAGLYGSNPCRAKGGLNFVELMLKMSKERDELRVVDDEFTTPTPTKEVARQLVALSRTTEYGLYHATCEGGCSWYEFASAIFYLTGTTVRLERARPGEFPAKVPRPKYSVLENEALKNRSLNVFRHWKEGLRDYLHHRNQANVPASA